MPARSDQLTLSGVLGEHRSRLRALEAADESSDSAWTDITSFTNNWQDASFLNIFGSMPRVGYMDTKAGWTALRGRIASGDEGLPAFAVPFDLGPPHAAWFVGDVSNGGIPAGAGSHDYMVPGTSGKAKMLNSGLLVPYINPEGFGGYPVTLLDVMGGGPAAIGSPMWVNANGNIFGYVAAGGFGIPAGPITDHGALFLGTERFVDCEASAVIGATVPTRIQLGVRCQYPYDVAAQGFPNGFWLNLTLAAGGNAVLFTQTSAGIINQATFNAGSGIPFTNPGFVTGDIVGFAINGTFFTISKNGATIFQVQVGTQHSPTFASGLFGLGVNGTAAVNLVTSFSGGMQRTGNRNIVLGLSLDNVFFRNRSSRTS